MPEWMQWLAWVSASMVAVGVIWTKGVRPLARTIRYGVRAWDELSEVLPIVRAMATEFEPNDGTSLRDSIDTIARIVGENQRALEDRILSHDTYHDGIEYRLRRLEGG